MSEGHCLLGFLCIQFGNLLVLWYVLLFREWNQLSRYISLTDSNVLSGQLFMCLVRGIGTAQVLVSIFIGLCNFFSGLIVRPQQMSKCGKYRKNCLQLVQFCPQPLLVFFMHSWILAIYILDQSWPFCIRRFVYVRVLER